jgi:hypothetical protein
VRDHHRRRPEAARGVRVAREVDDVGAELALEIDQPVPGSRDVVPGLIHPLELVIAGEQREPGDGQRGLLLPRRERAAHRRERDLHPAGGERRRELDGVGEDTAQGIGCHQDSHPLAHVSPP